MIFVNYASIKLQKNNLGHYSPKGKLHIGPQHSQSQKTELVFQRTGTSKAKKYINGALFLHSSRTIYFICHIRNANCLNSFIEVGYHAHM